MRTAWWRQRSIEEEARIYAAVLLFIRMAAPNESWMDKKVSYKTKWYIHVWLAGNY